MIYNETLSKQLRHAITNRCSGCGIFTAPRRRGGRGRYFKINNCAVRRNRHTITRSGTPRLSFQQLGDNANQ